MIKENLKYVGFAISILFFIVLGFKTTVKAYDDTSKIVTTYFTKRDSIINNSITNCKDDFIQIKKLKEQYLIIECIKQPYLYNAKKYNSYWFSFTIFFCISTVFLGIFTFLIIKDGWEKNNIYIKISFLIFFLVSTITKIMPTVFDNKENIKNNLTKYNYYLGLQLDIYDLICDNKKYIKNNQLDSLDIYISNINRNIKANQDLPFNIQVDKIEDQVKLPLRE